MCFPAKSALTATADAPNNDTERKKIKYFKTEFNFDMFVVVAAHTYSTYLCDISQKQHIHFNRPLSYYKKALYGGETEGATEIIHLQMKLNFLGEILGTVCSHMKKKRDARCCYLIGGELRR